jgi:hypothetical protein
MRVLVSVYILPNKALIKIGIVFSLYSVIMVQNWIYNFATPPPEKRYLQMLAI